MTQRLVIIDGKSVFYRGYYAMPNLATKDGTPTGGVYGFATMALEIVKKLKPDYVCVAWDKKGTNIRARLKLYPQYKAGRKAAPPDFYEQIPILHDLLQSLGWPLYEIDDYEADDIMGAFAKQAGAKGIESYLITSDLDVLQLVNSHTHIYTLKKGLTNIELFNEASFREKYGIEAHQWIDTKALKGDASDNIPGVAGVGEKTALELIKTYKTLDGVYENIELVKPTVKKKLEAGRDMAYLSKELVTLMVDAPIELNFDHAKLHDGVTPEFVALLRKLEFRALLRQVENAVTPAQLAEGEQKVQAQQLPPLTEKPFNLADFKEGIPRVIALSPDGAFVWVSADNKSYSQLLLNEEAIQPTVQQSLLGEPAANETPTESKYPKLTQEVIATLANGPVIGHDVKSAIKALLFQGLEWPGNIGHDTKIRAFVLNSIERLRELGDLLGHSIDQAKPEQVMSGIWQVYTDQKVQFDEQPKLLAVATELDFPTIKLLAVIEHRGITLDSANLADMSQKFDIRIKEFEQKIYQLAGQEFNIGSPSQLALVLFEKMQLPTQGIKKGKTGYSTGASELDKLRDLNPVIDLISQYREYTKLKSTYIDALPKLVDAGGKLHTTFNIDGAATGRLSSTNPNLQNIPTRTEIGHALRGAFVPAQGNVFVGADYSQFELRLAAVMADDKDLIESFNKDEDIHTRTAAEIYGISVGEVTKAQRSSAKTVNFGVLYGMSPHGLSAATSMNLAEAKEFIEKYFVLRAPIRNYMEKVIKRALIDGYVETIFGRRRPTPDLKSSNFAVREGAKRAAINMPIQGTEADLMKLAMLKVEENLGDLGQQILQVHDSILVETPKANAAQVSKILQETMEAVYPQLPVKLKVDVKTGNTWGEL